MRAASDSVTAERDSGITEPSPDAASKETQAQPWVTQGSTGERAAGPLVHFKMLFLLFCNTWDKRQMGFLLHSRDHFFLFSQCTEILWRF